MKLLFTHGHMTKSVLVPGIKDKNKRVNDKCNYSPICISNICFELVHVVLFSHKPYANHF